MTALTVSMHAAGTVYWIRSSNRKYKDRKEVTAGTMLVILLQTAVMLVLLHFAEVTLWALAYLTTPGVSSISDLETALYFSAATFTSLGYGDVVIDNNWRLLAGFHAIAGLLVFGWSSALLFAVVRRMMEKLEASQI